MRLTSATTQVFKATSSDNILRKEAFLAHFHHHIIMSHNALRRQAEEQSN